MTVYRIKRKFQKSGLQKALLEPSRPSRRLLHEGELEPGGKKMGCIKELTPRYVAQMEEILEVYEHPFNPLEPVICLDEKPVQILQDIQNPRRPEKAEEILKRDYEYRRAGIANVFVASSPRRGPISRKPRATGKLPLLRRC